MVYKWKAGFSVIDQETDEMVREAEMQLCLIEKGPNSKNQIRELFEIADLNFFHIFRGEKKENDQQLKGEVTEGDVVSNKEELNVNRGWLI